MDHPRDPSDISAKYTILVGIIVGFVLGGLLAYRNSINEPKAAAEQQRKNWEEHHRAPAGVPPLQDGGY